MLERSVEIAKSYDLSYNYFTFLKAFIVKSRFQVILAITFLASLSSCTFEKAESIADCDALEGISIVEIQATTCSAAVGTLEVMAQVNTGFVGIVSYSLDDGPLTESPIFSNLAAGTYNISTIINETCVKSLSATIENEDGLNITVSTNDSDCGVATGQIEITANDAIGTVVYSLDGTADQSANIFQNLSPGTYVLTVKDDANCNVSQEVKIASKIQIEDIVNTNCALSGCHGGSVSPNLETREKIIEFANQIKQRTSNKSMPPASSGIKLDDSEIDAIACWFFDNN